jgi:hypothetical protein
LRAANRGVIWHSWSPGRFAAGFGRGLIHRFGFRIDIGSCYIL